MCREDNLPPQLREGGSVRKGTVLQFSRDSQGHLKGKADGHPLVEVKSDKLCQAVFDLYFGNQVRTVASQSRCGAASMDTADAGPACCEVHDSLATLWPTPFALAVCLTLHDPCMQPQAQVEPHTSLLADGDLPVQPVSQKAKKTLGQSFFRLGQPGAYAPPQDKLICDRNSACAVAYA